LIITWDHFDYASSSLLQVCCCVPAGSDITIDCYSSGGVRRANAGSAMFIADVES